MKGIIGQRKHLLREVEQVASDMVPITDQKLERILSLAAKHGTLVAELKAALLTGSSGEVLKIARQVCELPNEEIG